MRSLIRKVPGDYFGCAAFHVTIPPIQGFVTNPSTPTFFVVMALSCATNARTRVDCGAPQKFPEESVPLVLHPKRECAIVNLSSTDPLTLIVFHIKERVRSDKSD